MKDISKDFLLMYFENEGMSGGGIVEDVQMYDENTAYIMFESCEGNFCLLVFSIFVSLDTYNDFFGLLVRH